ncbi:MAG: ChbG/HpnK family deacetylase [Candidatus Acidiferrales bacterium]
MKRLIVNADDFGYTRGVNSGVIRGFRDGIITSTTIMANGLAFGDAVEHAKKNPKLGVGCHLALVGGACVEAASAIPSLADDEGRLPSSLAILTGKLLAGAVRGDDIARELRAQISKVIRAGIDPTHLDSHKHTHSHPRVMEQVVRLADEFGIRRIRKPFEDADVLLRSAFRGGWGSLRQSVTALVARTAAPQFEKLARAHGISSPERLWGVAATGRLNRGVILSMIGSMQGGVNELMCHPGEYDEELEHSRTRLKRERERELEALMDPAVRTAIDEQGIELIDYRGLN